jgi:rubredoxin
MIDQNPQINAPVFEATDIKAEMQFVDDKDGGYWVCPVCLTDENLSDVTELN